MSFTSDHVVVPFATFAERRERRSRIAVGVLWVLMAVSGLTGRDLVGNTAYGYVGGYNIIVSTMLLLFVGAIIMTPRVVHQLRSVGAPS